MANTAETRGDSFEHTQLVQLAQQLEKEFDKKGLQELCFQLGVDHENLSGERKTDLARELVWYCDRHGRIPELEDTVERVKVGRRDKLAAYRQRLLEDTYFIELKGIPLPLDRDGRPRDPRIPLDKVYIRLQAIAKEKREQQERAEEREISVAVESSDFLGTMRQLAEHYYRRGEVYQGDKRPDPVDPQQALSEHKRLVVLGAPGAGKSTMLRYLARRTAEEDATPIPILVSLRDYATARTENSQLSLRQFALEWVAPGDTHLQTVLARAADQGRVLWLLDALDEARDQAGEAARQAGQLPGQLVLTSRPMGYVGTGLHTLLHFEVLPLAPNDVNTFLHNWLWLMAEGLDGDLEPVAAQEAHLKAQLAARPRLKSLTHNPLLLTFLVTLASREVEPELPHQRAQLYAQYVDELLNWEIGRRQTPGAKIADWRLGPIHGEMAYRAARYGFHYLGWALHLNYHGGQAQAIPDRPLLVETLAEYFRQDSYPEPTYLATVVFDFWQAAGMLDVWHFGAHTYLAFRHLTFQEYAAAWGLNHAWKRDKRATWQFLLPRLHHYAWREPLLLLAGLMTKENLNSLLLHLVRGESPDEWSLHRDLRLAGTILAEGAAVDDKMKRQIVKRLGQKATHNPRAGLVRRLALRMGTTTLSRESMLALLGNIEESTAISYFIAALKDPDWNVQYSAVYALSNAGEVAAIPHLITLLNNSNSRLLQASTVLALGKIGAVANRPDLVMTALIRSLGDSNWDVRRSAAWALGQVGEVVAYDTVAVTTLIQALGDSEKQVRSAVIWALVQIGVAALPHLLHALNDPDKNVRESAVLALAELDDVATVPALIRTLSDSDRSVVAAAIFALGQLGQEAIPDLIHALSQGEENVSMSAALALGRIGEMAVPDLIRALNDSTEHVRASAAIGLGQIRDVAAVPALIQTLGDSDEQVLASAILALSQIGKPAIPDLIHTLNTSDEDGLDVAIYALVQIGESAVPDLIHALNHSDKQVRKSAALALGKIRDVAAVSALIQTLSDRDRTVLASAVFALSQIGEAAIPHLIRALVDEHILAPVILALELIADANLNADSVDGGQMISLPTAATLEQFEQKQVISDTVMSTLIYAFSSSNESVPESMIEALEHMDDAAIPYLINALDDNEEIVRTSAARALGYLGATTSETEAIVLALIHALHDNDAFFCWDIAQALEQIGKHAVPHLIRTLSEGNGSRRRHAASVLGRIGDTSAVPYLITALGDRDQAAFGAAATALGQIGDAAAIPHLVRALADKNKEIRRHVVSALGQIGNTTVVPNIIDALEDGEKSVRRAAIWALSQIGNQATIPHLIRALNDKEKDVRSAAANVLEGRSSTINDEAQLQRIKQVLWWRLIDDSEVSSVAFDALERIASRLVTLQVARLPWVDPLR